MPHQAIGGCPITTICIFCGPKMKKEEESFCCAPNDPKVHLEMCPMTKICIICRPKMSKTIHKLVLALIYYKIVILNHNIKKKLKFSDCAHVVFAQVS